MKRIAKCRASPQFSAQHIAAGAQTGIFGFVNSSIDLGIAAGAARG